MKKILLIVLMALMLVSSVVALSPIGSVLVSDSSIETQAVYSPRGESLEGQDDSEVDSYTFTLPGGTGRSFYMGDSEIAEPSFLFSREGFQLATCSVDSNYLGVRFPYTEGWNYDTFNPYQISTYGSQCSVGQFIIMYACENEGNEFMSPTPGSEDPTCLQLFGNPYKKEFDADRIDLRIACNGNNCYDSNVMNNENNGWDWYNKAIEDRYVGYDCLSACDVESLYTCDDPDDINKDVQAESVIRKNGILYSAKEDYCDSTGKVIEYYCSDSNTKNGQLTATSMSCDSGEVCNNGACVREGTETPISSDDDYVQYSYRQCDVTNNYVVWYDSDDRQSGIYASCAEDETCYVTGVGEAQCSVSQLSADTEEAVLDAYEGIKCGACEGNRFVNIDVGREGFVEEPITGFDKFLISLGLKQPDVSRELTIDDDTEFRCEGLYSSSGKELYTWNTDTYCYEGEPVNNLEYFQPEIKAFYLKDSNNDWVRVDADPANKKEVPSNLMSGWKSGEYVDVIVEVTNYEAEVFDPSTLSDQQINVLTTIGDEFDELAYYNPTTLQKIERGFTVASYVLTGGLAYIAEEFSDDVSTGGELLIRGADFRDEYFKAYENVRTDYIDAAPWLNSGKIELAFYAADAAPLAYSEYDSFTRQGDITDYRIDRDTWYEVGNCQAPEDEWIQTFEILFVPPIENDRGEIEYWNLNMDDISTKKIRGAPAGGLNTVFVMGSIRVPNEADYFADGVTQNFDAEGEYYLHAAVFDRCWSPSTDILYLDAKGLRLDLRDPASENTVCCRTPKTVDGLIIPFYTAWYNSNYDFVLEGDCKGTVVEYNTCLEKDDPTVKEYDCYYCTSDLAIAKLPYKTTYTECNGRNPVPNEPDFSVNREDIEETCWVENYPSEVTKCITCTGEADYPGNFCDTSKGYFPLGSESTDEWQDYCGIDIDDPDARLVPCYTCYKGQATEVLNENGQIELYALNGLTPEQRCNNVPGDVYDAGTAKVVCQQDTEYAFRNPSDEGEWCWKGVGETKDNACEDGSYPVKDGINFDELDIISDLPAFKTKDSSEFTTSLREDGDNPICLYEYGDIMCSDDTECIRAIDSESSSRVDNKAVYDAIEDLIPANLGWTAVSNFFSQQFTGEGAKEDAIKTMGVCVVEDEPFNLRAEIAKLFGLRTSDPAVLWIMIGGALLIVFLISMLMRGPRR